jgi:penicillin-binding protein 1A
MSRRERQRRRRRHRSHPIKRALMMGTVLGVCALGLGALAVAGWVAAVADSAPNIDQLTANTPGAVSQVFADDGSSLGYIHSLVLRSPVRSSQIPTMLKHATIAIEDRRFYHHGALDYQGILRAAIKDVFNGGATLQGASTLTMQLIDNLYLKQVDHNLHYKIIQAKLAQELYKKYNRNWILTSYLNDVPYGTVGGQTAYGVQAAAEVFFNKPVWQLDLAQDALLAGLPQAPSEYNPFIYPGPARQRRSEVLQAMVQSHYIDQAQANAADAEPLGIQHNTTYNQHALPYAFDYVVQQLHSYFCPNQPVTAYCKKVDSGGLKIYTTIDPTKEAQARRAIIAHEGGPGQPAAALVSIDPTNGHILAIANSSTYDQTTFDYATQALRQPGSSFKVFALMTLIHDYDGDPNQTYYNSHFLAPGWLPQYPTYSVHTAEETYQGDISVTKATTISDNTVFAQLAVDLGMDKFDQTAYDMGITTKLNGNPSEVIGGLKYGVTPLEMADAYATLANGGWHIPPTAITKVVFPDGSVVNMGDPHRTQVFSYGETYAATTVLKTVITSGTGTAANYGCPAAGKTGTAENLENAWFVGYTPKLSTAVWVGYPQGNIPMANGFGGALAAPIWHDYMDVASDGYCGDWTPPAVPWHGTAFVGPHSSAPPAPKVSIATNPSLFAPLPNGAPKAKPGKPPGFGNGHAPGNSTGGGAGKKH